MITLITDFGDRGGYAGIMKGVILTINPRCPIVDITHHIAPQNIEEAAFVLGSAYPFFPDGTVHLVVVDPGVGGPRKPIIVECERHRFVGPDNGAFTHLLDQLAPGLARWKQARQGHAGDKTGQVVVIGQRGPQGGRIRLHR